MNPAFLLQITKYSIISLFNSTKQSSWHSVITFLPCGNQFNFFFISSMLRASAKASLQGSVICCSAETDTAILEVHI